MKFRNKQHILSGEFDDFKSVALLFASLTLRFNFFCPERKNIENLCFSWKIAEKDVLKVWKHTKYVQKPLNFK